MLKESTRPTLFKILYILLFSLAVFSFVNCSDDDLVGDWTELSDLDGNEWTKIISIEGSKRKDAVAFVVDGLGYVCTGIANGSYEDDFWAYDPQAGNWVKKRDIYNVSDNEYDDDYTNIIGTNKVAFSVNGKGYVATGGLSSTGTAVWEYNPETDLWTQKTSLEATSRLDAVGFTIGDIGYIATGKDGSAEDDDFDDLWGFKPGATQVDLNKIIVVDNSSSMLIVNN